MFKFIFTLVLTIPLFSQCVGTGCPGSSAGAVSSVFTRTGAITATSGDYTVGQITNAESTANKDATSGYAGLDSNTKIKSTEWPTGFSAVYSCSTSAYSDPTYSCSTGAGLSSFPPDGTLFVIKFVQVCTDVSVLAIAIDSLAAKQIFSWDGTSGSTTPICSAANNYAIIRLSGSSNYSLIGFGQFPICNFANSIVYNSSNQPACNSAFTYNSSISALQLVHLKGFPSLPAIAAGAAAGISPTVTLGTGSNDVGGVINITTGTAPTTGVESTITFFTAYSTAPFCTLTANNANTALVNGTAMIFPSTTTTTLVINSGTVALTLSTAYSWTYHCTQ